ncbi:MAG: hypothetical protein JXQ84_06670 [Rhodospirillaceae bacterium]|nr:hypothetical protein [Rhodospirillaceae bacterium]
MSPKDATSEGFHYPSTSAEQFLDLIITLADSTRGTFADYATSDPRRDVRYDPHYARFITPGLREAISREETQLVKKNCGGKYVDGEICGMDSDPITCTQDIAEEGYLFRTERTKRDMVIVAYRWPESTKIAGVHRLVRAGGVWKLDGIRCDPTMSFNMP